jgi:hypothetical protein
VLTREKILEAERIKNSLHQKINDTVTKRDKSQAAYKEWKQACRIWHNTTSATDHLWLDETRKKIRSGDRETIDDVMLFLEVDPWYFRSGYLKERLIEDLKRAPLNEHNEERIRHIIINVTKGRDRREFRYFCKLAARVASEEFEKVVEQEAEQHDKESHGKLSYLLRYLQKHKVSQ